MGRVFFNTRKNVKHIAAAYTVLPGDSGNMFMVNQASAYDIALPNAADALDGWYADFIVGTVGANDVTISATAGDGDKFMVLV